MTKRHSLPIECEQLTLHLAEHLFAHKGEEAHARAESTTLYLWNMVCAAVERVAPLYAPEAPQPAEQDASNATGERP